MEFNRFFTPLFFDEFSRGAPPRYLGAKIVRSAVARGATLLFLQHEMIDLLSL